MPPDPPAPSSRATTTACDTPACRSSTASISPGSIRKPRSFTCASARPKNSSTPSERHRARSPVRYIRAARQPPSQHPPCGSATNRSAVRPARLQIAPRKTNTRDVQLANNTSRHRLKPTVQHIRPRVPDRTANRHLARAVAAAGPARHVDRGLRRPVQVLQLHLRQMPADLIAKLRRQRLAAADHPPQARTGLPRALRLQRHMLDKGLQHRRHKVQRRHAMLADRLPSAAPDRGAHQAPPPPAAPPPSAARRTPTPTRQS